MVQTVRARSRALQFRAASSAISLDLLGGFELRLEGQSIHLPGTVRRLLAFLALRHHSLSRAYVSQSLWLDASERHAEGNLRSVLWKIGQVRPALVDVAGGQIALGPGVTVDYLRTVALARRLLDDPESVPRAYLDEAPFADELLPDWYEEWVLMDRERYRQLRLHALECLCKRFLSLGRSDRAIEAGLAAVAGEPLRESAHMAVMRAYVAEGNVSEAIRHYHAYGRLLQEELGVRPSSAARSLLESLSDRVTGR